MGDVNDIVLDQLKNYIDSDLWQRYDIVQKC